MTDNNTALKDLYDEYNPKLNLARSYSEFEETMKDPSARKDFYDSFNSELKLANSYNEFESVLGMSSPKPPAPSTKGGESGAFVRPITPSTSTSASEGSESESWTKTINPLADKGAVKPTQQAQKAGVAATPLTKKDKDVVIPKTYAPTLQENIAKIEGMTMRAKFPEYSNLQKGAFDFKQASAEAISKEEQAQKEQTLKRKEERRVQNLPNEIEALRKERADLLLDKSPEAKKKIAANEAVTKKMQQELNNLNNSKYESLQNLNQRAIKGIDLEINEYLEEDPKLKDKIKAVGLTETETWDLAQKAIAKKIAPLEADLQMFKSEGTVDAASAKINLANSLRNKQEKMTAIAGQMRSYETDYLNKTGFSGLNKELETTKKKLDSYEPYLKRANSEVKLHEKELTDLKIKLDSFSSLIKDNNFLGTAAQFEELKAIEKEYNNTIQDLNNVYKNESLLGYEDAVNNYNSLIAKKNNLVSGLKSTEYQKMANDLDALKLDYDMSYEDYSKYEDPKVKDRINQYFSTIQKIGEYDEKLKTTKGELSYIGELEKAQEKFNNTGVGGDFLDIGARAVNSILDASKKLVASPFRLAASFSDLAGKGSGTYHYSDWVADLIEGTGYEPLFLTKKTNNLYDAKSDKINLGFFPILGTVADQTGIILTLALTGKYSNPVVQRAMTTAGMDLTAMAEVSESAKIATTIAPAFMISYGDNYKEALSKGFSVEGAMAYSGGLSLLEGLTETMLPDQDLVFGKDVKNQLLNRFIKDYSKGKKYAIKNLAQNFLYNAGSEITEENIAALGKTIATSIGNLTSDDIEVEIPTINQTVTTAITSGLSGGGMGLFGSVSEQSQMYKLGVMNLANDFKTGKELLDKFKEKGKITDERYNKLISDAQKFQSVRGQIPNGLSGYKVMAIAEKMIAIRALSADMNDDKNNPINKINQKKINKIQDEVEAIIDDENFDKRAEYELNLEAENLNKQQQEKPATAEGEVVLTKNTSPTSDKYGTINRNDGKGVVDLTKEEFEAEQAKMQPKVDEQVTPTAEGEQVPKTKEEIDAEIERLKKEKEEELKQADVGARLLYDIESSQPLDGTDEALADKMIEKIISKAKGIDEVHLKIQQLGWKIRGNNVDRFNQFIEDKIAGKTTKTFSEWRNEAKNNIDKVNAKYDSQITELEKQYEKEPTKKEDGEPMSGGVQGVRTEGQEGKESAELRPEEEEVKPTPQKIKVLGKDVNMYNDYIPSKVEDVETDAMYTFSANSKDGIPTLLQDVAYSNKKEVNGVKTENWYASISGDELIKLYPKKEVTEQEITTTEGKPKEATPTAEQKVAVEGSTVTLPPAIKGGMERTMVFKDGEWQQQVGGTPTKVGDKLKTQADEAFKASQKPKVVGEKVEVKNAPKGNHLNIGLLEGRTNERMSSEDVLSKLPKDVKVISFSEVEGTEPTLSVETSRPLTDAEMTKLLEDTKQQAIPQLTEGIGVLYDAKRGTPESWGEFNPEYFVTQKGENLKQYASKEEVAETAKTEKTKEDVKQETKEKIFTYDKDGNIVEAEVLSKGKDTTSILLNGKQTVRANTEVFADRESAQKRIDSEVESDGLTEEDKEDLKRIDSDIYTSENNIENFKNEIETEKSNLKEEKERIKQEKAKVRLSSMSKKAKVERLEELDAELEDIINDHDDLIQQYRDDIAQEKQDIKRYKKEKAKLEQKAAKAKVPAVKKITTAAKKILDNLKPSKIFAGRDSQVSLASDDYKEQNGMSTNTPNMIFAVSEADGKRIADAYDQMKHDPDNPTVKQAFNELITEIKKQADALIARGYKFQIAKEGEGYNSDSQKMFEDVRKNKRIFVDPSSKSFGTKRTFDSENIGLQDSGYKDVNGVPMTNVELIRAVHDLFGHNEFGNGFGAIGEENAWRNHMSMFTPLAQRALTATTRGQNSWVNFGKHMRNPDGSIKKKGDSGYLSPSERPFAEQKIGLLPEWATENAYGDTVTINGKKIKPVNKYVVDGAEIYEIEDAQAFYEAAKAGKESDKQAGIQVELKSVEKIQEILDKGGRLLISKDGKVGMILESNGNAGSGFKNATAEGKNLLKPLLLTAIKLGARYTDAYDTFLPEYYSKFGFKPYKRIKFNPEFAEQGWEDTILKSKPDIVVMYWDGGSRENIEKNYGKFPEYSKTQGEYTADYEGAINEARDISNSKEAESSLIPNKTAKPEAGKEGEQITTKDAVQEPSAEKEVPRTGKAGEDLTEGGEGVGQSKQGEEAPQKSEKEVIQEYVDMYDSMREDDVTAMEKREMSEKMKRMLDENPKIKRIFDNIKNINKSLEAQGLITKTKGCP